MYVWPAFHQTQSPAASLPACLPACLPFSGLAPAKSSSSLSLHPAASLIVLAGGERINPDLTVLHQYSFYLATWAGCHESKDKPCMYLEILVQKKR